MELVLVVDGRVAAVAERMVTRGARRRGLVGRERFDGAAVLRPCRQVHTVAMRFAIDVAFCARDGTVLHACTLRPGRVSRLVWRSAFVVEAASGAFTRWGLRRGGVVAVRESAGHEP